MIAINEPDIEALIQERLAAGHLENVQQVLRQALQDAPLPSSDQHHKVPTTGAELLGALRNSPLSGIDIDFESHRAPMDVRIFKSE